MKINNFNEFISTNKNSIINENYSIIGDDNSTLDVDALEKELNNIIGNRKSNYIEKKAENISEIHNKIKNAERIQNSPRLIGNSSGRRKGTDSWNDNSTWNDNNTI